MSDNQTNIEPPKLAASDINVTSAAKDKFLELLNEAEADVKAVRIFVTGGGCSGMTYGMTFTDMVSEYDSLLEDGTFRMVVDTVALNYVRGCEIDYVNQGMSSNFVFRDVFQAVGGSGGCAGCGAG